MMKKKETEIATNVSSGAEKVEIVERKIQNEGANVKKTSAVKRVKEESAKGDAALGDSVNVKTEPKKSDNAEKENKAASARVKKALEKKKGDSERKKEKAKRQAERKAAREKRIAERKAKIEKRMAERKERAEKRAAERKALAEKRAAEREAAIRERAHAKANRHQAHTRKKTEKNRRKQSGEHRREKGYGGWIAAVSVLGVTTLALTTAVTIGAMEMKEMNMAMTSSQRGTMYELTGIMEHVDDDLDRIRISASPAQQSRILTDLLVQTRLAEADLEKLSVPMEKSRNLTTFVNRTARESERMLSKLRRGGTLSAEDIATLESLYATNHSIRKELNTLTESMTDKDLSDYMKEGGGMISEVMDRLEKTTLEENRAAIEKKMEKMKEAGMQRKSEEGDSAPTSLDSLKAKELCQRYFAKYDVKEFECTGETSTRGYTALNVEGYDEQGTALFAEIDKNSGALLKFDYYEDCTAKNFDMDNAKRIAEQFLESLGYEDMQAVRCSENGATAYITFAYEEDDVVYYPDEVRVKICCTRGVVSGMDATKYLKNHKGRDEVNVEINLETAYEKLSDKLDVEASKLAVISTARGELPAYEFLCSYGEERYFVYIDANSGDEVAIFNVANARW